MHCLLETHVAHFSRGLRPRREQWLCVALGRRGRFTRNVEVTRTGPTLASGEQRQRSNDNSKGSRISLDDRKIRTFSH